MLKPFYNKKKNIDDRLLPAVTAADAGKFLRVTEDGKIAALEGGGGGDENIYIPLTITEAEFLTVSAGTTVTKSLTDELREIVDSGDYKKINFILNAEIRGNPYLVLRSVGSSDFDRQWGSFLQFLTQGGRSSAYVSVYRNISDSDNDVNLILTQFTGV